MEGPEQSCGEYQAAVSFRPSDNNPLSRLGMANRAGTTSQHKYKSLPFKVSTDLSKNYCRHLLRISAMIILLCFNVSHCKEF